MILQSAFPSKKILLMAISVYASILGVLIFIDIELSIVAAILPLFAWFTLTDKKHMLYIFLLFLPFHSAPILSENLMGIKGFKIFNIIAAITLIFNFYHTKENLNPDDALKKKALFFFGIYFMIFTLATLRSISNLQLLHISMPEVFPAAPLSYLLSIFVKRSFYCVSFVYIMRHIISKNDIEGTITSISFSLMALSLTIIWSSLQYNTIYISGRSGDIWNEALGLHYNELGTILLTGAPLLLMLAFRGRFWGIVGYCLGLIAVVLLESRTAILLYLLASFLFALSQNKKVLFLAIAIVIVIAPFISIPDFLSETLQIGMQGDSVQVDRVFTGRTDRIWWPLFYELMSNPKFFLFGNGLFGIMVTDAYQQGIILPVTLAHNAYIDVILDCGVIVLALLIYYLIKFILYAWKRIHIINTDTSWALFVSIIVFLIACLTGRQFMPTSHTLLLFPIIALLVNTFRSNTPVHEKEKHSFS